MKTKTKNKNNRYDFGSFVEANGGNSGVGSAIGSASGMLGGAVGGGVGNALSSAGSMAGMGMAVGGPIGAIAGGALGLIGGIFGNAKKKRAEKLAKAQASTAFTKNYNDNFNDNLDTDNDNPYGTLSFAEGGEVPTNFINIEKGELQIDPETGKVLRQYDAVNPETGGLYKPHSKGKDTEHNFVTAEPGTFIVTKKTAKDYLKAIDNNDKLHQTTILHNIKNAKAEIAKTNKMADGGGVGALASQANAKQYWDTPLNMLMQNGINNGGLGQVPMAQLATPTYASPQMTTGVQGYNPTMANPGAQGGFNLGKLGSAINNYGVPLANIARGMFGKVEQQADVQPIRNPYKNQMLNNMPKDISFEPVRQQVLRQQNLQFSQIKNNTSSSNIARANMNNVFANSNAQLGKLQLDNSIANNQVRGQRSNIYGELGQMDMQAQERARQINQGIYQNNQANIGARDNLLTTGLGQLQQTFQNQNNIGQQKANDTLRNKMLLEMFPNLRFYSETFKR